MKLKCFECGKGATTEVPAGTLLRGTITCPECEEKEEAESINRIYELEELGRMLTLVVEDFLPNFGKCVLQNYERMNEALLLSTKLLGPTPKGTPK